MHNNKLRLQLLLALAALVALLAVQAAVAQYPHGRHNEQGSGMRNHYRNRYDNEHSDYGDYGDYGGYGGYGGASHSPHQPSASPRSGAWSALVHRDGALSSDDGQVEDVFDDASGPGDARVHKPSAAARGSSSSAAGAVQLPARPEDDMVIVNTLDGGLHGVQKSTGLLMWSTPTDLGPLVRVIDTRADTMVDSSDAAGGAGAKDPTADGIFVPEPAGNGDLYFYSPGQGMKKLQVSLKRIVEESSPFVNDIHAFTGRKESQVIALDPLTGKVLKTFGGRVSAHSTTQLDMDDTLVPANVVYMGRTQYMLNIYDKFSGRLMWNITFAEYKPSELSIGSEPSDSDAQQSGTGLAPIQPASPGRAGSQDRIDSRLPAVASSPSAAVLAAVTSAPAAAPSGSAPQVPQQQHTKEALRVRAGVDGYFTIENDRIDMIETKFKSPAVSVFEVSTDRDGAHLSKVFSAASRASENAQIGTEDDPSASDVSKAYVGNMDGTFYLLSDRQFPHLEKSVIVGHIGTKPENQRTSEGSGTLFDSQSSSSPDCDSDPDASPEECLLGWRVVGTIDAPNSADGADASDDLEPTETRPVLPRIAPAPEDASWMLPTFITFVVLFLAIFWLLWTRNADKAEAAQLNIRKALRRQARAAANAFTAASAPIAATLSPVDESLPLMDGSAMAAVLAQSQAATAATPETTSAATASQQNGTSVQAQPPSIAADLATETVDSAKDGSDPIRADEPQSTSAIPAPSQGLPALQALTLTDTILGYGSHGTVVYKGLFENREVAIKRLLVDFYEVADHEVRLLQESDHHPNVVRYYYKEQCEGFMYIALELCPASLFDLVEKSAVREVQDLRRLLKPKHILQEIMMGIQHLHSMKIVHRDIKPQNILIGGPKSRKDMTPRILISDFGLGKRLADDQSSFHNTVGFAGGTAGWRAPECLFALSAFGTGLGSSSGDQDSDSAASPGSPAQEWMTPGGPRGRSALLAAAGVPPSTDSLMRMSRAIDMFACGCLFYYVLTNGGHPFGDKFAREVNVLRNNYRLDGLDALKEEGVLAKDLIKRMISKDPKKRPDATAVLQHPFFWSATHRLAFLQDVSDRLEIEPRDPPSPLVKLVERGAAKVTGSDWCRKVDRSLIDNLGKYRKYDGASVLDLLRALRNKKHHYQDLPAPVKKTLGALPDAFLSYFESRFPLLLLHCYACVADSKVLRSDPLLTAYFGTPAS